MSRSAERADPPTLTMKVAELRPPEDASSGLPFVRHDVPASIAALARPSHAPSPAVVGVYDASPRSPSPPPPPPAPVSFPPVPYVPAPQALAGVAGSGRDARNLKSARAYSDEAVDTARRGTLSRRRRDRVQLSRQALVEPIGLVSGVSRRMRRTPELSEIVLEYRRKRAPLEPGAEVASSEAGREEADVVTVCSFAAPSPLRALREAQELALYDEACLDAPIGVVRGKLTPSLDPLAALQALAAMAQAAAQRDKRVLPLSQAIEDTMAGLGPCTWRAFERFAAQLDGWLASLGSGAAYASEAIPRRLLEQRAFRRQSLLGEERLRADLEIEGSSYVAYLPVGAATKLPLVPSVQVVAIVELRPREDASESAAEALLLWAVTRVLVG